MRFAGSALLALALCTLSHAQTSSRFSPYTQCKFGDELAVVETTPLAKGVEGRTVKTIMGPKRIPLADGVRLMYAYPQTEPLANVKIEQIPADDYSQARQDLIANFDQILTADDSSSRNYALPQRMHGLEIYGLDRRKLEGGVLGIYLFFVDRTHTVTSVYFLNQDPASRKFTTLEEYATLRDAFLESYTTCATARTHPPPRGTPASRRAAASAVPPSLLDAAPVQAVTAAPTPSDLPDAPAPQGALAVESARRDQPAPSASPSPEKRVPSQKTRPTVQAARSPAVHRPPKKKELAPSKKPTKAKKH